MILQAMVALAIVLSQVLDWHSTLAFLADHDHEGNSRLASLFKRYGASRVMIVKGLLHLPVAVALLLLPERISFALALGCLPFLIWYGFMIAKNYRLANDSPRP